MKLQPLKELHDLPLHPGKKAQANSTLALEGEVYHPRLFTLKEIMDLPTVKLAEDFKCLEGWVVRDILWEGVPVSKLVEQSNLKPRARSLLFCSSDYTTSLDLKTAFKENSILALKKSGKNLDVLLEGLPRLVFEGHDCYESVKQVSRIVARPIVAQGTASSIANARIGNDRGVVPSK